MAVYHRHQKTLEAISCRRLNIDSRMQSIRIQQLNNNNVEIKFRVTTNGAFSLLFSAPNDATSQAAQLEKGTANSSSIDFFLAVLLDLIRLKVVKAVLHDDTTSTEGILVSKTFKTHYLWKQFLQRCILDQINESICYIRDVIKYRRQHWGSKWMNLQHQEHLMAISIVTFFFIVIWDYLLGLNMIFVMWLKSVAYIYTAAIERRLPYIWKFQAQWNLERHNYSDIFSIPVSNYNSTSTEDPTCDTILHAQFPIKPVLRIATTVL